MSSRDRLSRLDLDTGWAYQHKVRRLQARFGDRWPALWCAYLGLLAEAWAVGDRRMTLADAWVAALPIDFDEALEALKSVSLLDRYGRIPATSWREWYEPVAARIEQRSAAGRAGAAGRWSNGAANATADASAMRPDAIAMHHTRRARTAGPVAGPRKRARETRGADAGPTKEEAAQAWAAIGEKLHGRDPAS